jgi:hypothetical protein
MTNDKLDLCSTSAKKYTWDWLYSAGIGRALSGYLTSINNNDNYVHFIYSLVNDA